MIKPFLYALMGHRFRRPQFLLPLAGPVTRKQTDREAWIPVTITEDGRVLPGEYHGSAHINALCQADGLVVIPAGVALLEEGTLVRVRPI